MQPGQIWSVHDYYFFFNNNNNNVMVSRYSIENKKRNHFHWFWLCNVRLFSANDKLPRHHFQIHFLYTGWPWNNDENFRSWLIIYIKPRRKFFFFKKLRILITFGSYRRSQFPRHRHKWCHFSTSNDVSGVHLLNMK